MRAVRRLAAAVAWAAGMSAASPFAIVGAAAQERAQDGAQDSILRLAPPPAFVVEHDVPDPRAAVFEPVDGVRALLFDIQHDATGPEPKLYTRSVVQAADPRGLAAAAQFAIPYDLDRQRLEINRADLIRGGIVHDEGADARLQLRRPASGSHGADGSGAVVAVLRLDDVRPGDVVDIAFTVTGAAPEFGDRDARDIPLRLPYPVERFAMRSLWPTGARWLERGPTPEVVASSHAGGLLLAVAPRPLQAIRPEASVPSWVPQTPSLAVSDFGDWADVGRWGRDLYAARSDPQVASIAAEIQASHPRAADQARAALRFVQDDIVLDPAAFGEGGYTPAPVARTLARRAGDSGDKALLLLALMDALGVEADAALVSAALGGALLDMPPSPTDFDHVVVRIVLDGAVYWLDPSLSLQGGGLDDLALPAYGYALPLDGRALGLVALAPPRADAPGVWTRHTFDLAAGPDAPVHARIEERFTGASADALRALIAAHELHEFEAETLENMEAAHGPASLAGETRMSDDRDANVVEIDYELVLEDPFIRRPEDPALYFEPAAARITPPIPEVPVEGRLAPVALAHQTRQRHEIVVRPPARGDLALEAEPGVIEDPAFRFSVTVDRRDGAVVYVAELDPRADAVPPDGLARALADQRRMLDRLSPRLALAADAPPEEPAAARPDEPVVALPAKYLEASAASGSRRR